ncbi:hypothetical protein [Nakamurella endophytica]|uniref:Uncharacterized protein n=1 Tax=Nakamurella endophytica TaxID=1748367 RepID=A0A917TBD3_9ACTN|nr:hypothetical protein [Nakamurella endophytica]GGM16058.1 hypothetical protein GCM10011594_40080 [Nakamurella endophytica]
MSIPEDESGAQPNVGHDPLVFEPGDSATRIVEEWLERPALRLLVERFGGTWPSKGGVVHRLEALHEFSVVWDRRQGASRLHIVEAVEGAELADLVLKAAQELGLVVQPPLQRRSYDWAFVLGGLATGCLSRVQALSALITAGTRVDGVALLGSFRQLQDEELATLSDESFEALTEVVTLQAASDRWLHTADWAEQLTGNLVSDPRRASFRASAEGMHGLNVHAFASASSEPQKRAANTADTYHTAVAELSPGSGAHILLVTSRIYRYQWLDAIRVLGRPCELSIELYGTESGANSRRSFGPSWYLQELRSMITSSLAVLR